MGFFDLGGMMQFQTKLTYGMICYSYVAGQCVAGEKFQTKLTYGMICYTNEAADTNTENNRFKLS